jgi:membrane-associated phospholipid phosphatase
MYPKLELHLLLNSYHSGFLDTFFKYYTVLAEWPLYILALVPLLWKKFKITLFYAICEAVGGCFVQLIKHLFSSDRPVSVFENSHLVLPLVQGVEMHHSNSFPSGHSSTFFMFFTCCAIVLAYYYSKGNNPHTLRTKILFNASQVVLLFLAALGAYSRVYLSQHFLSDICVGSIIGFTTPFLMFYFCERKLLKSKNKEIK